MLLWVLAIGDVKARHQMGLVFGTFLKISWCSFLFQQLIN